MNKRIRPYLIIILCLLFAAPTNAADTVAEAEVAYRNGDYDVAFNHLSNLVGLLEVAPIFDKVTGEDRDRVLFDLARCRTALGDVMGTRIILGELFRSDPRQNSGAMEVGKDDPLNKVLGELRDLRKSDQQSKINATSPLKASIQSLVVPGWGQRYRGHRKRGNLISATAGALAVGWAITHRSYQSALTEYRQTSELDLNLAARTGGPDDPRPFIERFEKVESRASAARTMGIALVSIWVYAVTENFVVKPGQVALTIPLD